MKGWSLLSFETITCHFSHQIVFFHTKLRIASHQIEMCFLKRNIISAIGMVFCMGSTSEVGIYAELHIPIAHRSRLRCYIYTMHEFKLFKQKYDMIYPDQKLFISKMALCTFEHKYNKVNKPCNSRLFNNRTLLIP